MTVVNKKEPYNQWVGEKFQVVSQIWYLDENINLDKVGEYIPEGEPFEVRDMNEFSQKLNEIRDRNIFAKELAEQEHRDSYTKKFIIKL